MTAQDSSLELEPIRYPQWLLFGDSITQQAMMPGGLVQQLGDVYQRKLDIVDRGYSGYNTEWARRIAPRILPLRSAGTPLKILSIWFGANDAVLPMRPQYVTIDRYKANLHFFIDLLQNPKSPYYSPDTVILITSPPPISGPMRLLDAQRKWGPDVQLDRDPQRTEEFAIAAGQVARDKGVGFVNVWTAMMHAAGPDKEAGLRQFLSDGLHLTPAGYQIVFAATMQLLAAQYPELLPDNVARLFPDWSEIDPKNPDAAFPPAL